MNKIEGDFHEFKILVVDDFLVNQEVVRDMLELMGCEVVSANNGEQALKILELEKIDMMFLDVNMPDMDGYKVAQIIREKEQQSVEYIPIVAITANALVGDKEKCIQAGMDDYISKPIKSEMLKTALQRYLRNQIC